MPKESLPAGVQIRNEASIVFDTNAPILTPEWLNTIDNTKPTSQQCFRFLQPRTRPRSRSDGAVQTLVPAFRISTFTFRTTADPSPFHLPNRTATSATFTGQPGHTYSFYSIARDLTGNVETAKTVAEATTRVDTTQEIEADLAITKTAPPEVSLRSNFAYTVRVTNQGPTAATAIVTDQLPAGLTIASATSSQGSCTGAPTVTCDLGNLASGTAAIINIAVRTQIAGDFTNTARVAGSVKDSDLTNNSALAAPLLPFLFLKRISA